MIPRALWKDGRLKGTDWRVLFSLQGRSFKIRGERRFEPVRATTADIAGDTGLSERWVRYTLRRLEILGLVRTQRWPGRGRPCAFDLSALWTERQKAEHMASAFTPAQKGEDMTSAFTAENRKTSPPPLDPKRRNTWPPPQDVQTTATDHSCSDGAARETAAHKARGKRPTAHRDLTSLRESIKTLPPELREDIERRRAEREAAKVRERDQHLRRPAAVPARPEDFGPSGRVEL